MKIRALHLLSAALALLSVCTAQAQTVTGIFVGRSTDYVQTDASTVIVDPTAPGPTYGGAYGFTASVSGTGLSAPTVTLAAGSTMPSTYPTSHNGGVLGFNADEDEWQYGSPNFNNWATPTAGQRHTLFALGDYTFSIPGFDPVTLSLNAPTTPVAAPPTFTLSGGTWTDGKYEINPSQTLTITSSAFTAFSANADGNIFFEVYDKAGSSLVEINRLYSDDNAAINFISYTISPGTLIAGHEYVVDAGFAAVVDKDTTISGAFSVAFFDFSTTLTVSAIPEPSTYAMLAGVGALGLAVWRRRQKTA